MHASSHKVLYVHFNTAGSWLYSKYAYALKSAGAEVSIVCLDQPPELIISGFYDGLIPVTILSHSAVLTGKSKMVKELERIKSRIQKRLVIHKLRHHLKISRPTHLVAGDPFALAVCASIMDEMRARLIYVPFEFYPEHVGANARQMAKFTAYEERHLHKASTAIFLGDSILSYYHKKYSFLADKAHVVYSSWPTCQNKVALRLRADAGVDAGKKIILYQGSVQSDRGLVNVVKALKSLPDNTMFVILGYGPECDFLDQCAVKLGVREKIKFLPPVPQQALMSYTKDADVGIIPLFNVKSHRYACPGKLFEYIAAELPLVVSDMPDLKRIVAQNRLGEVYASDSIEDLTRALSRLLENKVYRMECVMNARQAQSSYLSWEKQSDKLCGIIFEDGE